MNIPQQIFSGKQGRGFGRDTRAYFGRRRLTVKRRKPRRLWLELPRRASGADYLWVEGDGGRVRSAEKLAIASPPEIGSYEPRSGKPGRVPGLELMIATPTVRQLLEEGRTLELAAVIRDSAHFGCMTFNQSLFKLYERGEITREDALANADNPDEMEMMFRGIQRGAQMSTM